jgi:ubiquitin-activating enzyme E1 C
MLCALVTHETSEEGTVTPDLTSVVPFIDGGTEGLKGHARVIFPRVTACFECTLDLFPPQIAVPLCTIAGIALLVLTLVIDIGI